MTFTPERRRRAILNRRMENIQAICDREDFQAILEHERLQHLYMLDLVGLTNAELEAHITQLTWLDITRKLYGNDKPKNAPTTENSPQPELEAARIAADVVWAYWYIDGFDPLFVAAKDKIDSYCAQVRDRK